MAKLNTHTIILSVNKDVKEMDLLYTTGGNEIGKNPIRKPFGSMLEV